MGKESSTPANTRWGYFDLARDEVVARATTEGGEHGNELCFLASKAVSEP